MPRFSDEDLTAYLDGEASAELAAEISSALRNDPLLAEHLDALEIDREAVSAAFGAVLSTAPSPPENLGKADQTTAGHSRAKGWQLVAAAIVGLVVGASALFMLDLEQRADWQTAAAIYHKLYVTDTLEDVTPSSSELAAELQRVSDRLQREIRLEDIDVVASLSPRRAQILSFSDQPLIQIAFLSADGLPVALCIFRNETAGSVPLNLLSIEGMSAATWSEPGYEFMLIGGTDDARIQAAALAFSQSL